MRETSKHKFGPDSRLAFAPFACSSAWPRHTVNAILRCLNTVYLGSQFLLFFCSLDRVQAVSAPLKYMVLDHKRRLKQAFAASYAFAGLLSLLLVSFVPTDPLKIQPKNFTKSSELRSLIELNLTSPERSNRSTAANEGLHGPSGNGNCALTLHPNIVFTYVILFVNNIGLLGSSIKLFRVIQGRRISKVVRSSSGQRPALLLLRSAAAHLGKDDDSKAAASEGRRQS